MDEFDAGLFSVSTAEATLLDPQQRLILESAYCSMQNLRQSSENFSSTSRSTLNTAKGGDLGDTMRSAKSTGRMRDSPQSNVGVFVGISYNEYGPLAGNASGVTSTYTATGSSLSVAAGNTVPIWVLKLAQHLLLPALHPFLLTSAL